MPHRLTPPNPQADALRRELVGVIRALLTAPDLAEAAELTKRRNALRARTGRPDAHHPRPVQTAPTY